MKRCPGVVVVGIGGRDSLLTRLRESIHSTLRQRLGIVVFVGPAIGYRLGSRNNPVQMDKGWLVKC